MKKQTAGIRIFVPVLLSLWFVPAPAGAAIDVDKVPNPLATSNLWVGDSGGVLGPEYIALLNSVCETLKVKTSAEFAVVTVDDLGGRAIEDFTARLFKKFGIGEAGKENGLLLLFSRDDRKVRFEVGYGLEGTIPDALASRILDEQALPFFKEGQYGRGLFATAKTAAETIGAAAGVTLGLADPAAWPGQITPPQPIAGETAPEVPKKAAKPDPLPSALISAAAVVLCMFLGYRFIARRVAGKKGKAAKEKAALGGYNAVLLTWVGSVIAFIVLAAVNKAVFPYLLSLGVVPAAASFGQGRALKALRRKIAAYREPCGKCGQPMSLLDEQADDAFLSAEELAEENAGGLDYEVWQCDNCHASESFPVKLGKAAACPKCGRWTLVTTTTTLAAATGTSGGKVKIEADCKNPSCDYQKITERNTPRVPPPSVGSSSFSGRSSFGSSGRSSFGGGRSGGGGASKSW
ncbi:MAG: TPM domain-containing protein [Candidatus Aminicenantes bacterium]|nr:TPM domain-containing protein [Candidatus Aminicenantes bacterium]